MFVLVQTERNTSPAFSRATGLVGVYNSYEAADDVMSNLFDFYEDSFDAKSYGEFDAHLRSDTYGEIDWYIFDADSPDWHMEA